MRYLSEEWFREAAREVADDERLTALADNIEIGVTQVVTGGPDGDITYHLQLGDGRAEFRRGPADPEHVRLTQSWSTASRVANDDLNAQEAFIAGLIELDGDTDELIGAQAAFPALDEALAPIRRRTEFD